MAITVEARTSLIELVVGMFGAAPGASVLSDLVAAYEKGQTIKQIAANLANTTEFKNIFPTFLTNAEFATKVVDQLVGNEVVAAEKAAAVTTLTAMLNAGASRSSVFVDAIDAVDAITSTNTAWANAGAALDNKVAVAVYYSVDLQRSGSSLAELQQVIDDVNSAASSVDAAKEVAENGANPGGTFSLTTGEDNLTGTSGNDIFSARIVENNLGDVAATLQGFDQIDGGAGTDTLQASLLDDVEIDSSSVEVLELKGGDAAGLTVGIAKDVATLTNNMVGETVVTGAAALAQITQNGDFGLSVEGMKATTVGLNVEDADTIAVDFAANGTAKAAQTLNVSFNGDLSVDSALTETLTVTANGGGSFAAKAGETAADVFDFADATALTTATVTGTGDIEVTLAAHAKLTSFDASGLVGGVDVAVAGAATSVLATVKGGQGDDSITVTNLKDAGSINLGAGDDVIQTVTAKGAYTIDAGAGDDEVAITNVVASKAVVINGGDGDDLIDTTDVQAVYATTGTTLTVDGGDGDDTVYVGALIGAKTTVNFDGGDGDADVIRITDGLDVKTAARIANFEVLDVTEAVVDEYDMSRELSFNAVLVNDGVGDAKLSNVQADTTLEVRDGGDATIEYVLQDDSGKADQVTVSLTQNDSKNKVNNATATPTLANTLTLTAEGVETVTIDATAQVGTNTKGTTSTADDVAVKGSTYLNDVALTSATVETVTVSGNAFVTLDLSLADALTLVDASDNTGGIDLDFSGNTTEVTFLGGSGNDVVTANTELAVIDAGTGADTITAGGMTIVVYGDAADSKLGLTTAGTAVAFTAMDTIDDAWINYDATLQAGDRIDLTAFDFTGGRAAAVKASVSIASDAALLALVKNTASAGKDFFLDGTVDRGVALASYSGLNYLFVDANKDGDYTAADDLVVLVGATDMSVNDFIFAA